MHAPLTAPLTVAYVSSFPPRACGIATFTRDLSDAVAQSGANIVTRNVALNEDGADHAYPPQVRWTIDQHDPRSWIAVARQINISRVDLVSIQHEFGICGRFAKDGQFHDHLACFLATLRKPVVATLHTVPPHPPADLREAIRTLHDHSAAVVTMINRAGLILEEEYGLDPARLRSIPHGVPAMPRIAQEKIKHALGCEERTLLCTFGLLNRGKGIEYVIQALPEVLERRPDVLYFVIGQTHPEVRRYEGEQYRESLIALVTRLRLEQHVRFVDQYLATPELVSYLQATDIYITPYRDRDQITSGTLAYALGCGRAIISTPYLYAAEVLDEGRGLLAEFENPTSFARCINLLLENPALRAQCERSALQYGRAMSWPAVGTRYADLFHTVAGGTAICTEHSPAVVQGEPELVARSS